ncbi:DUF512 domain-containing protein [candidate division KSB1 bacterium]
MIIKSVEPDQLGGELGLREGDRVFSINGYAIRDVIDYRFHVSDPRIIMKVGRNGEAIEYDIEKEQGEELGVVFEEISYRHCGSKCPFCFVDQNPDGMRKPLYFRDEDYRLSFLHGSYFTLNNVSRADLKRIIDQRLTPLYISVHALDPEVRAYLFGVRRNDRLLEKIGFLVDNGIELHTQVVLCPGINDGEVLEETVNGLKDYFPGVRTLALVPVGLTKHREGLDTFQPVTPEYAGNTVTLTHKLQRKFLKELGERFLFLSDEWYFISGRKLPSLQHYGELYQLENGVGLTRQFLKEIRMQRRVFTHPLSTPKRLHILTGTMARPVLEKYLEPILNNAGGLSVTITGVVNEFYGPSIHVSGLLSGSDFLREIEREESDLFLLPPNCFNPDGLTLDDMTVGDMMRKTGKRIMRYNGSLREVRDALEAA